MSLGDNIRKFRAKTWTLRPDVLLCPNTPKPMHGLVPREIMGQVWWDKIRREAYRSTAFHCIACGIHKRKALFRQWLEGHEIYEVDYLLGRWEYLETVPLCHACHNYIHSGRMEALLDQGKMTHAKFRKITQHGNRVLREAKLKKPKPYSGPFADWSDWRLVFDGKEYPPKFKTHLDWERHYG